MVIMYFLCIYFRIFGLQFCDEMIRIEAHESEILCVEFSSPESGKQINFYSILLTNVSV